MNPPEEEIYLDHSAATPLRVEVLETMMPYLRECFGNAGSAHRFGRRSKKAVDQAREQVAALINADPGEIIFTSGGTESDNLALFGVMTARRNQKNKVLVSAVEHHAVLHAAESLARHAGVELQVIGVDSRGRVDPGEVESMLDDDVGLVSVMFANNETGTLQPIEAIGKLCRQREIPFHTDAVQAVGKIPVDVRSLPVDLLAISGHKIHGPKGIGACYARRGVEFVPQTVGGAQERGRRSGTENVAGIVGLGKACELARVEMEATSPRMEALADRLQRGILEHISGVWINGSTEHRLPHILNVGFKGIEGQTLLFELDTQGIAVSTGSTCASGSIDPSHVLLAMGQSHVKASSAIRFSLGRDTTAAHIDKVIALLPGLVERLRENSVKA